MNKRIIWNTRKKDGWTRYKEKTENNAVLNKIANSNEEDPGKIFKGIDKGIDKGKVFLLWQDQSIFKR